MAVLLPGAALIALSLALTSENLGYLSMLLVAGALMVAAAGGLLIRPNPERSASPETTGWLVMLFILGAVATGVYWYRVWLFDAWDLGSIPMGLLYAAGFWWPGLLLAALAWILSGPHVFRTVPKYLVVLGVGLGASVAGAASYQLAHTVYFKAQTGERLDLAMQRLQGTVPGPMAWQNHRGALTVIMDCGWATEAPPYTVIASLRRVAQGTLRMLPRADVTDVNLQATAGGLLLFSGEASDALPGDPDVWLNRMDRSILKDGGLLDRASLVEMAQLDPTDMLLPEEQLTFENEFAYELGHEEVSISFTPGAPVSLNTIAQYAAAYRVTNRIVNECVKYFTEIKTFRINFAGSERTLARDELTQKPFYLQADLMPATGVVGLVARDRGLGAATLTPAEFKPMDPLDENQIALVTVQNKFVEHKTGRLFEAIPLDSSRLYVTEVGEDGAVTLFLLPHTGVPAGPVTIAPGTEDVAVDQWINNLGLMDRALFGS
jgi:hypothetical protein